MAKSKGIFRVQGNLGGANFYTQDGKSLVRNETSLDRHRILTGPEFKRTRENMAEFGAAALCAGGLRMGLAVLRTTMFDSRVSARITGKIRRAMRSAPGARGQRSVEVVPSWSELRAFQFNGNQTLGAVLGLNPSISTSVGRDSMDWTVPAFDPDLIVIPPVGASHFRLVGALSVVSDFVYNATDLRYEASDPILHGIGSTVRSAEIPLIGAYAGQVLTVSLPPGVNPGAGVGVAGCIGIEFLQLINGTYYLFAEGNALQLQVLF